MRTVLKSIAWILGILAALGLLLYAFFLDVWTVHRDDPKLSASILPLLHPGDVLLVARRGSPSRNALVRCDDPDAPGRFVVARIVALPGETVKVTGERLFVDNKVESQTGSCDPPMVTVPHPLTGNDVELDCAREGSSGIARTTLTARSNLEPNVEKKVDEGRIYLLSDNRHFHLDSRDFGALDPATCRHVVFRLWSDQGPSDSAHRFTLIW